MPIYCVLFHSVSFPFIFSQDCKHKSAKRTKSFLLPHAVDLLSVQETHGHSFIKLSVPHNAEKNADVQELLMKQDVMNYALLWERKKQNKPALNKEPVLGTQPYSLC